VADVSDFNPAFASKLDALRAALTQAGIGNSIVSGYRSPEYQGRMYANHLAQQAGQPLPYPNDEAPAVVAPPWRSFHNYGMAADFNLTNPNDYARLQAMAPQYGLTGIGMSDKGHIQLGGSLADDIAQYHLANWRPAGMPAPATGAIAYSAPSGQPSRVATTAPGTTLNSTPMDIVLNAESGDRNIPNVHQTTSSGQAQGNAQITTGTWTDFAPKAGVDLKQYPTPMDAPRDVQIKVASVIPLNRWASSTVNAVLAKYPGIDTSQPLGAIQSAALNRSGAPAAAPGAPAAPPAPQTAGTTLPGFQPGSPANKMTQAGLQQLAGGKPGGGATDEPPPMPLQQSQSQAMGGPMMMRAGQQNMEPRMAAMQALAQQGFMTQPSVAAFGGGGLQSPVPSTAQSTIMPMAPGGATGMPMTGIAGTTLNSPSQLQMALMTGALSPYDMYARQAGS
jgi:D-alanyl-D-alanine carboxypeptidase